MDVDTSGGHPAMDYKQSLETYGRFLKYTKYAIIFLVILMIAMYYFLV